MKHRNVLFILIIAISVSISIVINPVMAAGLALPAVPNQTILNKVIMETHGPTFTPLYAPNLVRTQLIAFSGVFDNAENMFSTPQAISYISTSRALKETILPLLNSRTAVLDPVFTTPGLNPRPGKIIGALFQPSGNMTHIVVAVFDAGTMGCVTCVPKTVRFYYNSTQYTEVSAVYGRFLDADGNNTLNAVDEGALITQDNTCVTVGLEQVCWKAKDASVRDNITPKALLSAAYTRLKGVYNFSVSFKADTAVPDLIGSTRRSQCAAQLQAAQSFTYLSACLPNLAFAVSTTAIAGQPIGLFSIQEAANLKAYTAAGVYKGMLPAGQYLVMDATPTINKPGAVGVLFLINADTLNHYLIPSVVLQGFGNSTALDKREAAIRDGCMAWRGW